jgi:hypothetical protein
MLARPVIVKPEFFAPVALRVPRDTVQLLNWSHGFLMFVPLLVLFVSKFGNTCGSLRDAIRNTLRLVRSRYQPVARNTFRVY